MTAPRSIIPTDLFEDALLSSDLPYLDVKLAYGAVGDGVANDTSAIQSALTDANAGPIKLVYLAEGTYRTTTTLLIGSNVTLFGAGIGATIIKTDGAVQAVGATDFPAIRNLDTSATGNSGIVLRDFSVDGSRGSAVYNGTSRGIFFTYVSHSVIQRVKCFANWDDGFAFEYCRYNTISDCFATDNAKVGFYLSGSDWNTLSACVANDNVGASTLGFGIAASWFNTVTGCLAEGNPGGDFGLGRDSRHNTLSGNTMRFINTSAEAIASPTLPFHADHPGAPAAYGAEVWTCSNNIITGNTIINSPGAGITLHRGGGYNLIAGNTIGWADDFGINISGQPGNTVRGNVIFNTGRSGANQYAILAQNFDVTFTCNNTVIDGNRVFDDQGPQTTAGIYVAGATPTGCIVRNNIVTVTLSPLTLDPTQITQQNNIVSTTSTGPSITYGTGVPGWSGAVGDLHYLTNGAAGGPWGYYNVAPGLWKSFGNLAP
jgi:parallel beta-helix repeat protein